MSKYLDSAPWRTHSSLLVSSACELLCIFSQHYRQMFVLQTTSVVSGKTIDFLPRVHLEYAGEPYLRSNYFFLEDVDIMIPMGFKVVPGLKALTRCSVKAPLPHGFILKKAAFLRCVCSTQDVINDTLLFSCFSNTWYWRSESHCSKLNVQKRMNCNMLWSSICHRSSKVQCLLSGRNGALQRRRGALETAMQIKKKPNCFCLSILKGHAFDSVF